MAAIVWKGYVSFGLVSFPVRLLAAARPQHVSFHMLHAKDKSRVKEVWYCVEEDKPIDRSEIVKGYEIAKNEYIVVDEEDLKKIAPPSASTMDILQFVKASEVDPVFLESSYYVAPEEAVSKPYALLTRAMQETGYYAVAKIAMHAREHIVIIRPGESGLILHTMYFVDELNRANAAQSKAIKEKASAKEIDLAKSLIKTLAAPFKPEQFHDEYRANVEKLLEQKSKGGKISAVKQPPHRPVVNILEALEQSLKQKPVKADAKAPPKKRTRKAA